MTKTVRLAGNVGRVVTQDELAEIQQRYRVRERDWLELEIAYEGRGEAEFSTNPGTIGGPTSIRYREDARERPAVQKVPVSYPRDPDVAPEQAT